MKVVGKLVEGVGDFRKRMIAHAAVFERVVGDKLYPGTLNVEVPQAIACQAHFRICGKEIGEPDQDLLFERCTIFGRPAYRIRPFQLRSGGGGHGDHILEIASAEELRPLIKGREDQIKIEFHR